MTQLAQRITTESEGSRSPGRPRSEQAEAAIIDATLELLGQRGIAGLSIEAVANLSGVAKTTIYRRWSSKSELILDALAKLKGPPVEPPGESVRDDLIFMATAVSRSVRHSSSGKLMCKLGAEVRGHPELAELYMARIVRPRRQVTHRVLDKGIAEGIIRPDIDRDLVTEMLIGPIFFAAQTRGRGISADGITNLVDILLAGMAPTRP